MNKLFVIYIFLIINFPLIGSEAITIRGIAADLGREGQEITSFLEFQIKFLPDSTIEEVAKEISKFLSKDKPAKITKIIILNDNTVVRANTKNKLKEFKISYFESIGKFIILCVDYFYDS